MKRRLKPWVSKAILILMILSFCGIVYYSYKVFIWKQNVDSNDKLKNEINEFITTDLDEETDEEETFVVDFEGLKEQNPDTVAYLRVNGVDIDYVIVKGSDNTYYLKHNFKKEWNSAGWIFADYKNQFNGTDKNIVMYGHNMLDGSMFGKLKKVLSEEWYSIPENLDIVFVTEKGSNIYKVFSTYSIDPEEYYITTDFKNDYEYGEFLRTITLRSVHDYNVKVNATDSIITLSSCTSNGTRRIALHAVKVV